MVAITGLMKKGQPNATGIGIGGGVRIQPGPAQAGGNRPAYENSSPNNIDVEAWQPGVGDCPSR
jgi:hypothetical protein